MVKSISPSAAAVMAGILLGAALMLAAGVPVPPRATFAQTGNAPTNLTATKVSSCGVSLDWTWNGANLSRYEVRVRTPRINNGAWSSWNDIGTAKPYIFKALLPDSPYTFQVRTVLNVGNGGVSNEAGAITDPIPDPVAPTAIHTKAWQSAAGGTKVVLGWTPPAGYPGKTSGFRVYRSADGGASSVEGTFALERFTQGVSGVGQNAWDNPAVSNARYQYEVKTYRTADYCGDGVGRFESDGKTPDLTKYGIAELENKPWIKFSAPSASLFVPPAPTNVTVADGGSTQNGQVGMEFSWDAVAWGSTVGTNSYEVEIWKGSQRVASQSNITNTTFRASVAASRDRHTFKVRARTVTAGGENGFSDWSTKDFIPEYLPPEEVTADLVAYDRAVQTANVLVRWKDLSTINHHVEVLSRIVGASRWERLVLFYRESQCPQNETLCRPMDQIGPAVFYPNSYEHKDVAVGAGNREYQVVFKYYNVTPNVEKDAIANIALDRFTPITGWAFAAAAQAGTNKYHGIGWIKLQRDNAAPKYGVYASGDGTLYGFAWAGPYGWLSFGSGDTRGCPITPCTATVAADGKVSGWARFTQAFGKHPDDPSREVRGGAWDGWVSLGKQTNETVDYGLTYTTTTENGVEVGKLSGFAWGGDVGGWIWFGDPSQSVALPQIVNVTPLACVSDTNCPVRVEWENPVEYREVEIHVSPAGRPNESDKNLFLQHNANDLKNESGQTGVSATSTGAHVRIVPDLAPSTDYGFFIRGFTE